MGRVIDWAPIDAALDTVPAPLPQGALRRIARAHGVNPQTLRHHIERTYPRFWRPLDGDECPGCPECAGFVEDTWRVTVLPVPPICWCAGCGRRKVAHRGPWATYCAVCRSGALEAA
jgi:hypothetical protein